MIVNKQVAIQKAGVDWTKVSSGSATGICILPTGKLLAIMSGSLIYSDDDGETWSTLITSGYSGINTLFLTHTGRIISVDSSGYIVYSDDDGETWARSNKSGASVADTHWSFCETSTHRLFVSSGSYTASGGTGVTNAGIWYSDDDGETWTQLANYTTSSVSLFALPNGRLICGGYTTNGIIYSDDNGSNWAFAKDVSGITAFCLTHTGRLIAAVNNYIYCIQYSDDNGVTWYTATEGLTNKCAFSTLCETSTGRIIAGCDFTYVSGTGNEETENGGCWYSDDNGITWVRSNLNHFLICEHICAINTGKVFICGTDGGVNSGQNVNGLYASDNVYGVQPYSSLPVTGEQAKEYVRQFKAYVQSLKS